MYKSHQVPIITWLQLVGTKDFHCLHIRQHELRPIFADNLCKQRESEERREEEAKKGESQVIHRLHDDESCEMDDKSV